ncbi:MULTISPECIES: winged helix-turn-helix domain-containing protein [unclassified Streptomyces]|uniref:GntR family transcriptional regulator n=1 Tax=unclassified Streptomyces TaxID=2593676 RepID=UPI002E8127B5|nr:winged helix-turn-helix domain-containing protein [Streptomyces sp. NBC_00562]WUC20776.1 winged helix-turn-helix domain-containing protein [Streptomyces sp. NBC_00562]
MTSHGPVPGGNSAHQYKRIADELLKGINSEVWRPGDRLPTHEQLADRFDVSRATVKEALKLLSSKGLIVTRQGSGTFVSEGPKSGVVPQRNSSSVENGDDGGDDDGDDVWAVVSERVPPVLLKPYLEEAFEATQVKLDVFSMTTESLAARVSDQKNRIMTGEIRPPRSITARLLLPDCDFPHLAIPRPVDGTDDPRVRRRLKGILQSHATMLREALFELRYQGFVPEVDVEVRLVPFAPQMKLYILNRRLALQGFYVTEEGTIPLPPDREEVTIYDAYGAGATLFPYRASADATPDQAGIVRTFQAFFDSNWDKLAVRADF